MAKNCLQYLLVLLLYSCSLNQRDNTRTVERIPLIVTKTDTVYVEVEIPLSMQQKYEAALREYIGVKELTGNNDGEAIVAILKSCGINIPAPWCACFLHQGLLDIGLNGGPTFQPAFTPRWFQQPERIVWTRDINSIKEHWQKGWVGGIYFRKLGRVGHVAAVLEDFGDGYVLTIEGNSNSQGAREGNRVSLRIRHKSEFYIVADWLQNNEKDE